MIGARPLGDPALASLLRRILLRLQVSAQLRAVREGARPGQWRAFLLPGEPELFADADAAGLDFERWRRVAGAAPSAAEAGR